MEVRRHSKNIFYTNSSIECNNCIDKQTGWSLKKLQPNILEVNCNCINNCGYITRIFDGDYAK